MKLIMPRSNFFLGAALLSSLGAMAQGNRTNNDTTIKSQSINIYSTYKPEIAPTPKPSFVPSLPVVDTSKPTFSYDVPDENPSYTYKAAPLKPLALSATKTAPLFENYLKFGLGNLSSILVDAGIGSIRGTDYDALFHLKHLSKSEDKGFKRSANTALDAAANYYVGDHVLHGAIGIKRDFHRLYGYDTALATDTVDLGQRFLSWKADVAFGNVVPKAWDLWYRPSAGLHATTEKFGAHERSFVFDVPIRKTIDSVFSASFGFGGNFTQFKNNVASYSNNYFQVNPAVDMRWERLSLHLGVNPTWAQGGRFYALPDLWARLSLAKNHFTLFGGWKNELVMNSYQSLTQHNPFMDTYYVPQQGIARQIFGGFEASVGSHLTFGATVSHKNWRNMALFVNDYLNTPDGRQFTVVYDTVSALNFEAKIQYQINKRFWAKAQGSWHAFSPKTQDKAWHQPGVVLSGGLNWLAMDKLTLGVEMQYADRLFARMQDGSPQKLPAYVDLSAYAEYQIIPRLSVFLKFSNLTNQNYQMWYRYPVYGFNVIGGLRFKF